MLGLLSFLWRVLLIALVARLVGIVVRAARSELRGPAPRPAPSPPPPRRPLADDDIQDAEFEDLSEGGR
jgi:hypothetical protein